MGVCAGLAQWYWDDGTLFATLYIVQRERRKAERAQAEQVIIWEQGGKDIVSIEDGVFQMHDQGPYSLQISNKSQQSVLRPSISVELFTKQECQRVFGEAAAAVISDLIERTPTEVFTQWLMFTDEQGQPIQQLLPGEQATAVLDLTHPRSLYDITVEFRDAAGSAWTADPTRGVIKKAALGHRNNTFLPFVHRKLFSRRSPRK